MVSPSPVFRIWRDQEIRSGLLEHMDTASTCSLRLTASEFCHFATPSLFARTHLTFTPSALTRPSRLEALSRIGPYIEHLAFSMPHTAETFLPPLLNPLTGREVNFLYTPHTTAASVSQRPKYGSPELGDLLTQQFPPIFHAATNVPAFIKALSHMPNLRHLAISCPGQDSAQRYRRDAVDYALTSLRISVERAPLLRLEKLSLNHMHPSGLLYLRHMPGFGCTPSAGRRWKQIRKLNITMDSWDFLCSHPGLDHLKILDDYVRTFSSNLEKVSFGWNGRKGPCPFTLFTDPLFTPPREIGKLFGEVTSPMSPLPAAPARRAMTFPKLRYMQVRNATMSVEQVANFVYEHCHTVREFDFEHVLLINDGSWEDALSPLTRISGNDEWLSHRSSSNTEASSYYPSNDGVDNFGRPDEVVDSSVETLAEIPIELRRTHVTVIKLKKKRVHRRRRRKHRHKEMEVAESPPISNLKIPNTMPIPKLEVEILLQPTTFDPNVQGVQRNRMQEAAQQELCDDPCKQLSTLKKAREAVLKQLGREFSKSHGRKEHLRGFFKNTCSAGAKGMSIVRHESSTALVPLMFSRY